MHRRKLFALAGALLVLTACQHSAVQQSGAAAHGISAEALDGVQQMMDAAVEQGRIPSAIAMVAREDEVIWLGTAGEMGPGVAMRDNAIMPLASVGKMHTAVAAMILVERGVIALDDPVSRYIPEFANVMVEASDAAGAAPLAPPQTSITIRHLLTHTGGLRMSGDAFWAAWNANVGRTTTTHMARALAALPLESQPGAQFSYFPTGASYEALAAVIEVASGQTLEAFMQENVFEPLGLEDTYFYLPADKSDRLPAFYHRVDGALQLDRAMGDDFPRSAYFNGGGGVQSSPRDVLRFAQIFLNDGEVEGVRILQPATVRMMMSDQLGDLANLSGGLSWGFGAAVPRGTTADAPTQYGWVGGGYAILWIDRRERLVAYFAFPVRPPGDNALLNEFRQRVAEAGSTP